MAVATRVATTTKIPRAMGILEHDSKLVQRLQALASVEMQASSLKLDRKTTRILCLVLPTYKFRESAPKLNDIVCLKYIIN